MKTMNNLSIKLVSTLFVVCFILAGCTKERDSADSKGSKVKLLETITVVEGNDIDAVMFEYDKQGRIVKQIQNSHTKTFTYNSAGDLIKVVEKYESSGDATTYTFTKNGNIINETCIDDDDIFTGIIELNAEGLPVKISFDEYYTIEYKNGNVTKMTLYDSPSLEYGHYTFTYDDKNSPWLQCKTPKWYLAFAFDNFGIFTGLKNNPTTIEGTFLDGWSTSSFTYTYNNDGYPTKTTLTETEGYGKLSHTYNYNISYTYTK